MIALLHRTPWASTVHVRPAAKAAELADLAQPGDTLHKLPDDLAQQVRQDALMSALRDQLMRKEFSQL